MLRKLTAIMVTGWRDVLFEYCATNADTLQLQQPGSTPPARSMKQASKMLQHVGLSPLQEQNIALMMPLWLRAEGAS